jgi:hypothetical protein
MDNSNREYGDYLDPKAEYYYKTGRNRRRHDDPTYGGPERRLGRKRKKELERIITALERELRGN